MSSKTDTEPTKKRTRISQSEVPAYPLEQAMRIGQAIADNYASQPAKPLDVAAALDMSPSSGGFRTLTGASIAYGLTEGGYNATEIALTDLGRRVTSPLVENDDLAAKREALLKPKVVGDFLNKYSDCPLAPEKIAHNVLSSMGVPQDRTADVYELIVNGAESLGLLQEIKGKRYVNLDKAPSNVTSKMTEDNFEEDFDEIEDNGATDDFGANVGDRLEGDDRSTVQPNRRVFITHGKNKGFVEPIKKLLRFGEFESVVSVEKQSVSQPVPEKVMSDMRSCGAAIIHVQGEQVLLDQDANEHIVLNPNVMIEIGAAMALYGKRFILLVKEGTKLPSNLQGLYEVRYEGDALDGTATIKLLEAINEMKAA